MSAALHAFVALLLLACAAVALAPATLADGRVATATSGVLRIGDASGTVWQGRGTLTDAHGTFALPLAWRLDPWSVPGGGIALRFDPSTDRAPSGDVRYREGSLRLERFEATLPAALLPALARAAAPVTLGGELRVALPRIDVAPGRYDGAGSIRWTGASLSFPTLPPLALGDIDIALASNAGVIVGDVANRGGDLGLAGTIQLGPTHTSLDVLLTPGPGMSAAVAGALVALGRSEGPATRVQWQGPPLVP